MLAGHEKAYGTHLIHYTQTEISLLKRDLIPAVENTKTMVCQASNLTNRSVLCDCIHYVEKDTAHGGKTDLLKAARWLLLSY